MDDEDTDDDNCHYSAKNHAVHVGCMLFHHESRYNPKPPVAEVEGFKATHPKHPMIICNAETSQEEVGQGVLARFHFSGDRRLAIAATATDAPVIVLYTGVFSCGYIPEYCDAYTIEGKQFQGIDILDWNEVSFKSSYRRDESTLVEMV